MSTRFYLTNKESENPPAVPFSALWDFTGGADPDDRRRFLHVESGVDGYSPPAAIGAPDVTTTAGNQDLLIAQYVSMPLVAAATIAGTLRGQVYVLGAGYAADHYRTQICARVVSGDGTTVRGVLYAGDPREDNRANEVSVGFAQSRQVPAASIAPLDSVVAQAGDRVVVEVGVRREPAAVANGAPPAINPRSDYVAPGAFGDTSDLPHADNALQDFRNSWVEFSANIPLTALPDPEPPEDYPPPIDPDDPDGSTPPDLDDEEDYVDPHLPDAVAPAETSPGSATVLDLIRQFSGAVQRSVRLTGPAAIEMVSINAPLPAGIAQSDAETMYHSTERETLAGEKVLSLLTGALALSASAEIVTDDVRILTSAWRIPGQLPIYGLRPAPVKRVSMTFSPDDFNASIEFHVPGIPLAIRRT